MGVVRLASARCSKRRNAARSVACVLPRLRMHAPLACQGCQKSNHVDTYRFPVSCARRSDRAGRGACPSIAACLAGVARRRFLIDSLRRSHSPAISRSIHWRGNRHCCSTWHTPIRHRCRCRNSIPRSRSCGRRNCGATAAPNPRVWCGAMCSVWIAWRPPWPARPGWPNTACNAGCRRWSSNSLPAMARSLPTTAACNAWSYSGWASWAVAS